MDNPEKRSYEHVKISDLQAAPHNARTHSKRQIDQIANSIRRFGFTNPILIDDARVIIAGHGRVAAAKDVGLTNVPCVLLSSMTAADKRAYVIADNKLALNAGWDTETLASELRGLMDSGFEIELTGFDLPEIDLILTDAAEASSDPIGPEDEHPRPASEAITHEGDLWTLGRHFLLCGDAKNQASIAKLMAGSKADMFFGDPPYNVKIGGHVSGLGAIRHREFAEASGEMSKGEFTSSRPYDRLEV